MNIYNKQERVLDRKYDENLTAEFKEVFVNAPNPVSIELLEEYLSQGLNPNVELAGYTLLGIALIGKQHDVVVRLLLSYGANPNQENASGETPLMIASYTNSYDMVKLLIKVGAKADKKNNHGQDVFSFRKKYPTGLIDVLPDDSVKDDVLALKKGYDLLQLNNLVSINLK